MEVIRREPRVMVARPDRGVRVDPISAPLARVRNFNLVTERLTVQNTTLSDTNGTSRGSRAFPKWKPRSIRSTRAVSWQCSLWPRTKIKHCGLDSCPFGAAFAVLGRIIFLLYFISDIFVRALFESASKINILMNFEGGTPGWSSGRAFPTSGHPRSSIDGRVPAREAGNTGEAA